MTSSTNISENPRTRRAAAQKVKAACFGDTGPAGETFAQVYGLEHDERLRRCTDLYPTIVTSSNIEQCLPELEDIEVIFSTWGMLHLTESQLDRLPCLRAVFYAAGSVDYFARPLLRRGIIVTSSAGANAVPVAEFALGQILLANKGYWRNVHDYRQAADFHSAFIGSGNYDGQTVSILGAGAIGRKLIELMRPFHLRLMVFDPFLEAEDADKLGVEKAGLHEAFALGNVVSNHLADVAETCGLITGELLASMPKDGVFINTGRGRTVRHAELADACRARADLTALLDVTDPEPLPADSALWSLPNIHITSHIAGSKGHETLRLADMAIEEFERWSRREPLRHSVKAG